MLFWAGNQGNHQNFEKNDTSYETQCCFHWKKTKQKKILKKKSKWPTKKANFPAPPIFSPKFHGLVIWLVELIDAKGIGVTQPICL